MPKQKLKCVIYTRKSTEEGLEQDYNSLDAQRDAGEAYIKSQQHEGWELVGKHYDDGGFSGGNLNRPALQALLADIQKGKVDVVIVYKVDRLSRSLSDFAKLVEIFDQNNVTFVSVTQAFNTTNSMGRLTLNILLSFAQFEREVTGERIRDKFASSLKKGMWMGGRLILGYDVQDRKLVVNEKEAAQVRSIFEGYLKHDSIYELLDELKRKQVRKKLWVTKGGVVREGKYFDTSSIYSYLRNATYIGKVKHKGKVYEGEHEPIISVDLWDKVQAKLDDRKNVSGDGKNKIQPFILRGKLFDENGNSYQTTYTSKKAGEHKKFIRYYKVKKCTSAGYESNSLKSINADELEGVVSKILHQSFEGTPLQGLFLRLDEYSRRHALQGCIEKVALLKDKLGITFNEDKKQALIDKYLQQGLSFNEETVEFEPFEMSREGSVYAIHIYPQKVSGKLVLGVGQNMIPTVYASHKHEQLIHALKTAHQCHALLKTGKAKGVTDLSRQLRKDRSYLSKVQKLYSLSPKIKAAILDGKQPEQTTVRSLLSLADSLDWKEQEKLFAM